MAMLITPTEDVIHVDRFYAKIHLTAISHTANEEDGGGVAVISSREQLDELIAMLQKEGAAAFGEPTTNSVDERTRMIECLRGTAEWLERTDRGGTAHHRHLLEVLAEAGEAN